MKPKIVLTGKNGQVGSDLAHLLPRLGEVIPLDRRHLDLTKPEEIRQTIRSLRPRIIVNAAAYTAVDRAENEEALARAINSDAPGVIAEEAKKIGALLVHYSTDYVFDGSKTSPYTEEDPPNPINVYGRTKLAGEQAIVAAGVPHLIFRAGWVYSTRGHNFLLTILRLATQRKELRVVSDQFGSPTWSHEIAVATAAILRSFVTLAGGFANLSQVRGTYHMTASGQTSWYDFAGAILEKARRLPANLDWFCAATGNLPILAERVVPIAAAEYPAPARRPLFSVLSNSLLVRQFGIRLPAWQQQLERATLGSDSSAPSS